MNLFIIRPQPTPFGISAPVFHPATRRWNGGLSHYALEAWERMTQGGVNGHGNREMEPFVTTVFASGHQHTEYLAYAAR